MNVVIEEDTMQFMGFPKMARLSRDCMITEKNGYYYYPVTLTIKEVK